LVIYTTTGSVNDAPLPATLTKSVPG
jgi:hypothetical protein